MNVNIAFKDEHAGDGDNSCFGDAGDDEDVEEYTCSSKGSEKRPSSESPLRGGVYTRLLVRSDDSRASKGGVKDFF